VPLFVAQKLSLGHMEPIGKSQEQQVEEGEKALPKGGRRKESCCSPSL